MAQDYTLYIDQGANFTESITVNNVDLTTATISSKMRPTYASSSFTSFTITPTLLSGGQFTMSLTAAQTAALTPGKYVYDLIYSIGGNVIRVMQGIVDVSPMATY
jgi:hypothetical protein